MSTTPQVRQVLLMVDYGPEHPESGNVYDLTAQVQTLLGVCDKETYRTATIALEVRAGHFYDGKQDMRLEFSGSTYGGKGQSEFAHSTPHLADVMNMLAPPSERVLMLKGEAAKAKEVVAQAEEAVTAARMEQLAGMRLANPVARLTTVGELMGNSLPVLTDKMEGDDEV